MGPYYHVFSWGNSEYFGGISLHVSCLKSNNNSHVWLVYSTPKKMFKKKVMNSRFPVLSHYFPLGILLVDLWRVATIPQWAAFSSQVSGPWHLRSSSAGWSPAITSWSPQKKGETWRWEKMHNNLRHEVYPLVNCPITTERSTIFNGKIHYKSPFSIAILT